MDAVTFIAAFAVGFLCTLVSYSVGHAAGYKRALDETWGEVHDEQDSKLHFPPVDETLLDQSKPIETHDSDITFTEWWDRVRKP